MADHSYLGASAMKIRMPCPGSYALSKIALEVDDTVCSAEGTATHWVAEQCLRSDGQMWSPVDFVETTAENGVYLRESLIDAPTEYVNAVRQLMSSLGAEIRPEYVERRVDLSWVDAEMFGTSDFSYYHTPTLTAYCFDYKNGYDDIEAEDNPQLAFYLLDAYNDGAQHFVGYIAQPNAGGIKRHVFTRAEMTAWITRFRDIAAQCRSNSAPRTGGSHCKHCPAKAICPENMAETWARFAAVATGNGSPEHIAREMIAIEAAIESLRHRREALSHTAYNMAYNNGVSIPGHKLVAATTQRTWRNEDELIAHCELNGVDPHEKKLLTPAKLSRIIDIEAFTVRPEGKPKLVKQTQRGTPIGSRLSERFANAQGGVIIKE